MKSIEIDRTKRLREEPHTGHNRWHPDIPPIIEVETGEDVVLETRDALDRQIQPGMARRSPELAETGEDRSPEVSDQKQREKLDWFSTWDEE